MNFVEGSFFYSCLYLKQMLNLMVPSICFTQQWTAKKIICLIMQCCLFVSWALVWVCHGFEAAASGAVATSVLHNGWVGRMEAAGVPVMEKSSVCYCCKHHQSCSLSRSVFSVLQTKTPCIWSSRGENSSNLPCVVLLFCISGAAFKWILIWCSGSISGVFIIAEGQWYRFMNYT